MTPVRRHSQPTQCAYIGLARGSVPSTPRAETRRRCAGSDPPSMRPSPGRVPGTIMCRDHQRRAVPGVRQRTVARGRQAAARLLHSVPALPGDCRGRPCGKALAGQPEGWPSLTTNKRCACAAPLSRSTGAETASATTSYSATRRRTSMASRRCTAASRAWSGKSAATVTEPLTTAGTSARPRAPWTAPVRRSAAPMPAHGRASCA